MERDKIAYNYMYYTTISTHTLTWSVTIKIFKFSSCFYISTHTLTWSVTAAIQLSRLIVIISTHTLTWSVTTLDYEEYADKLISTHTLTWSVTIGIGINAAIIYNFNSHAHVERDGIRACGDLAEIYFNSHAHVERDLSRRLL